MFSKLFAAIFALVLSTSLGAFSAAHAVTVSASYSYSGDICDDFDADGGVSGTDFNDCDEIVQDGGEVGLFGMELLGLRSHIVSDAIFTLTVRVADLFAVDGSNNAVEAFGLLLDDLFLGTLFDANTYDEAAVSTSLAASVESNIPTSGNSDTSIDLNFTVAEALIAPLVQDQKMTAWFDFQGDVNSFRDVDLTVTYEAVPLPASALFLLLGLAGLGVARRRA